MKEKACINCKFYYVVGKHPAANLEAFRGCFTERSELSVCLGLADEMYGCGVAYPTTPKSLCELYIARND